MGFDLTASLKRLIAAPARAHALMKRLEDAALARFNHWFTSQGGIYQTLLFTLAIVCFEHLFPRIDPDGLLLLYWLTVYSAVTQPMLAYANDQGAARLDERLTRIEALLETVLSSKAQ